MSHKEKQDLSGETSFSYDNIPNHCIDNAKSILDIGAMSGINAILSRHRRHFVRVELKGKYLGVDILEYPKYYLSPIIIQDFLDFETDKKFDLVSALHVIEHIPFKYWDLVFDKLKSLVSVGGHLVIATPYKEGSDMTTIPHFVFEITEKNLFAFIPDAEIKRSRRRYRYFREPKENLLRAIMRLIWRMITRHKYRWKWKTELILVWKKETEQCLISTSDS